MPYKAIVDQVTSCLVWHWHNRHSREMISPRPNLTAAAIVWYGIDFFWTRSHHVVEGIEKGAVLLPDYCAAEMSTMGDIHTRGGERCPIPCLDDPHWTPSCQTKNSYVYSQCLFSLNCAWLALVTCSILSTVASQTWRTKLPWYIPHQSQTCSIY